MTTVAHALKPGDILEAHWGYDQTNIDFYRVVKITPTMVYIVQLKATQVEDEPLTPGGPSRMTGKTMPSDQPIGPMLRRKVRQKYNGEALNVVDINEYTMAQPWRGHAVGYTAYG